MKQKEKQGIDSKNPKKDAGFVSHTNTSNITSPK